MVEPFDKNGYGTGFVYLNNQDLSVFLIQKGLLKVDLNSKFISKYTHIAKEYLEFEYQAKKEGVGMWKVSTQALNQVES